MSGVATGSPPVGAPGVLALAALAALEARERWRVLKAGASSYGLGGLLGLGAEAPELGIGIGAPAFEIGNGAPGFEIGVGAPASGIGIGAPDFGSGVGVPQLTNTRFDVCRSEGMVRWRAAPSGEREYGGTEGFLGVEGRVMLEANSRAWVLSAPILFQSRFTRGQVLTPAAKLVLGALLDFGVLGPSP